MMLANLTFLSPALLTALLALPLLYWLLRLTPPRPKRVEFPPTKILFDLKREEETPNHSPLWLLLLRLSLALAVILGLAAPLYNPSKPLINPKAPVILVIDNGVLAAKNFDILQAKALSFIRDAEMNGQAVALISTAEKGEVLLQTPSQAREKLLAITPKSYQSSRDFAGIATLKQQNPEASVVLLSDGYASDTDKTIAPYVDILVSGGLKPTLSLHDISSTTRGLSAKIHHPNYNGALQLNALDVKGLVLSDAKIVTNDRETVINIDLPLEVKNQVARLEVAGERSAASTFLIDRRFRKKAATIISSTTSDQGLLNPIYYLERALEPYVEKRTFAEPSASQNILKAIEQKTMLIFLTDIGVMSEEASRALNTHVEEGAILVRFAGSRLTQSKNDTLLPVKLRSDIRQMGGSLSWDKPRSLSPFPSRSPFKDMVVPNDIKVFRQVLAEPDGLLNDKTWAHLEDGTPIITAEQRGRGQVILFHVTANVTWSDLPLSGVFLQIMERITQMSGTIETATNEEETTLIHPPLQILDGYGALNTPPSNIEAMTSPLPLEATSKNHAGLYGFQDNPIALNVFAPIRRPIPLDNALFNAKMSYEDETAIDFRPILLKLAFILLLIDCFAMLIISGHIKKLKFIIPLLFLFLTPVDAQIKGSDETRLVFVKTGKANIDSVTLSGLKSLTRFISNRTTLEPQEPIGIDLERDELNIHPLLYFVVTDDAPMLSVTAKIKLEQFLKGGGMLLLDTRDAHLGATAPNPAVRRVLLGLDIPEMSPMPKDHVLGRTYYLLDSIVGRYANGTTWVESLSLANDDERPVKASDNVTPIIITSNDLAGAWAVDEGGKALLPVDGVRQREMAYRAGVNIVFYALTGNYKADQVHAPALLERLGRKK